MGNVGYRCLVKKLVRKKVVGGDFESFADFPQDVGCWRIAGVF